MESTTKDVLLELPKLINDAGILTVLASLFLVFVCVIIFLFFKSIKKRLEKYEEKEDNKEKDSLELLKEINNKINKNNNKDEDDYDNERTIRRQIRDILNSTENVENKINSIENKITNLENRVLSVEENINKHIKSQNLKDEEKEIKEKEKKLLPENQITINNEINENIQNILEKIRADKIDVYIFSNGTKSIDGIYEFVKFNHTHNRTRCGVEDLRDLQEFPYGCLSSFFMKLFKHKVLIVDNNNINNFDVMEIKWLKGTGAEVLAFGILNYGNTEKHSGFIVAQYTKESSFLINKKEIAFEFKKFNYTLDMIKKIVKN